MEFELSREDTMISNAIRDWVTKECTRDQLAEWDTADEVPAKLCRELGRLGFCGMSVPEEFGGEGRNILGACIVTEQIASLYPALARWYARQTLFSGELICAMGSQAQQKKFLPKCSSGRLMLALTHREGKAGQPLGKIDTTAMADGDGFILNGEKHYITHADQAQWLLVLARTANASAESGPPSSATFFLIDAKQAGVTITPVETLGYKGAHVGHVTLNDVKASRDAILGGDDGLNQGAAQGERILDLHLLTVAAEAVGMARGALDYTLTHARQRVQFGQAIGKFEAIRRCLVETACEIDAAQLMLYRAAWLADQRKPFRREIAMAKHLAGEVARKSAMEGLQIFGGYGYSMEYDIQRYVRDAMALTSSGAGMDIIKDRVSARMGL